MAVQLLQDDGKGEMAPGPCAEALAAWRNLKAERDAARVEVATIRSMLLNCAGQGDTEAQARAWSAVWKALVEIGLLSYIGSLGESGLERAVGFVRKVAGERDAERRRAEAAEADAAALLDLLRPFAAILRHKQIHPPMNPGIQDQMWEKVAAALASPSPGAALLQRMRRLEAVAEAARQHALKKILCAGQRDKGTESADLIGAIAALNRAVELQRQREAAAES